jgi:signal transduction histidine kinase/CheY-like chemotaxis protein
MPMTTESMLTTEHRDMVERLKGDALIKNNRISAVATLVNLVIAAGIMWSFSSPLWLGGWALIVVANSVARLAYVRFLTQHPPQNLKRTVNWIAVSILTSGVSWGLPLFVLEPDANPAATYVIIYILAGMSAGAVVSFSSHFRAVLAFTIPMVTLTAVYFFLEGGAYSLAMVGVLMLFLLVTTFMTVGNNRMIDAALNNQIKAELQSEKIGRMAASLEEAVAQAELASTAKSQFLANMSHEIRTPLNGVLGMAQLLERTPLNHEQKEFTRTITSSGQALLDLISDVLDISRIEAGMMRIEPAPFVLDDLVDMTVDTVTGTARTKGLEILVETDKNLPKSVVGDIQRLRQVLINLAGNAVKFTDAGHVEIMVRCGKNDDIRFVVKDTGPGLTKEACEGIFERFAQADNSATRRHVGSGLGLAIVHEIVSLSGGRVGVESTPGIGSSFWFEVPLPPADAELGDAANRETSMKPPCETDPDSGWTVLVVDDVATNRVVANSMLTRAGHRVIEAENGREAIEVLDTAAIDLVLMDLHMPVLSGDEAIAEIRNSDSDYRNVPIIALTADATDVQKQRLLAIGANSHATKPIDISTLLSNVDSVMTGRRRAG